ncbi:MAG: protein translocase SEC61 complex subunit gamma [Candidatus Bilamarchaeaceae archaeon]
MDKKELLRRCLRVFVIAKKPDRDEYMRVAKVTGIGMIAIGLVGFVLSVAFSLIG